MKRSMMKLWLTLVLFSCMATGVYAEKKQALTFRTEDYCAATWNASTNTFTWGLGGSNSAWTFMAAEGISGDLSGWTRLHLHVENFTNASAKQLRVVFKKNDGSFPPNGPTKEFVVSPDENGDIDINLEGVTWGNCDITKIQDLTIYGGARDDNSKNASVVVTDAYYVSEGGTINEVVGITVGSKQRQYRLYVPKGCPSGAPLVVAMHGASGKMDDQSPHFNEIADTAKFIIAYPQGDEIFFPVFGGNTTGWDASGEDNADAAFIRAIVDELAENYGIDRKRVYCCGFSNGGMNTYAMANVCSDVFAAFASISGFPLNEFHLRHVGARPVPFLHIHGKGDNFVKYSLMPTIVDEMVARMGANPVPVKSGVSGKYDKSVYEATEGSFPYIYYEIDGMGHNDFTTNTEDGNSSLTMWRFFRRYTLDSPCDPTLKWMPRVEEEGFTPKTHGWTVKSGTTLLAFGQGSKTDANQNVYPSLQLTTGHYKLSFRADGEEGKTVSVKMTRFQTSKTVFNKTVNVGEDVTIYFDINNDDFGQYKLSFIRKKSTDDIAISNIVLRTLTDEEVTGIQRVPAAKGASGVLYNLQGHQIENGSSTRGIYIKNGKKLFKK